MKVLARLLIVLTLCLAANAQDPGKIFVVRHAEKQSDENDTPLSNKGRSRAECLAETLHDANIRSVLVTQYVRTKQTAAAVVRNSNAKETQLDAHAYAQIVNAARLAAQSGNVLIVGHSNSIPKLLSEFGTPQITIADNVFDLLFIVDPRGPKKATILHYCPNLPPDTSKANAKGQNSMAKPQD